MGGFVCWWRNLWLLWLVQFSSLSRVERLSALVRNLWLPLVGLLCEGSALNLPQGNNFLDLVLRNLWLLGVGT